MELKFRTLRKEEIEVRVGSGGTLLLYKDARCDMALLDEVVGVGNWQREHKILGDDIYCKVGIFNKELNCWVWVEDAGSSGNIEIEKTKASDSFKRACVNLGIGRELYTAPKITIPEQYKKCQYFDVSEIAYNNNREISKLVITTNFGRDVVFSYPKNSNNSQIAQKPQQNITEQEKAPIRNEDKEYIANYIGSLSGEGYNNFFAWLKQKFNVEKYVDLNASQGIIVVEALKRKKQ